MQKYILWSALCFLGIQMHAQNKCNYSGLQETSLKRHITGKESIEAVKANLPGGGLPDFHQGVPIFVEDKREITEVLTGCDAEGKLEGTVYYKGYSKGYLRLEAVRADDEVIPQITAWYPISTGGSLPFTLAIAEKVAGNSSFHSLHLKVSYSETKNVHSEQSFYFEMIKEWKKSVANENKIILARLIPLKTAQRLTETFLPKPSQPLAVREALTPPTPTTEDADKLEKGIHLNASVNWMQQLYADVPFADTRDIAALKVFKDLNPKCNTYYYMPQKYGLHWNKTTADSLNFRIHYGTSTNAAEEPKVTIHATLSAGITEQDVAFVAELLKKQSGNPALVLKPWLPTNGIQAQLNLEGQIPMAAKEKITIHQPSDLHEPIQTAWFIEQANCDDLLSQLEKGHKIMGEALFKDHANNQLTIPIEIALNDKLTYGRFDLEADKVLETNALYPNRLPFPIKIDYVHALVMKDGIGFIYSWQVESNPVVPPQAKIQFHPNGMPAALKKAVKRIWVDYSVAPCKTCFDEMVANVSAGTAESRVKYIRFQSYYKDFFDKHRVQKMKITVKSLATDPQNRRSKEVVLDVKPENATQELRLGPLYIRPNQSFNYQYRYTLITTETTYYSDWMSGNSLELALQKQSFEQAFPNLR